MAIPRTKEKITDGNLAFSAGDADDVALLIGPAAGGVVGQIYDFSDPELVADELVGGPVAEAAATTLEAVGGSVRVIVTDSTPATTPTVEQPAGTPPAVGLTGNANDDGEGIIEIVLGGALGTSSFKWSFDGGDTWSPTTATAATKALGDTGLTATFAAGTYVAGDQYTFTAVAPAVSIANYTAALDKIPTDPRDFGFVALIGSAQGANDAAKVAATAALAAALQTKLEAFFNDKSIFTRGTIDGPDVANDAAGDTALITGLANVVAPRVLLAADFAEIRSPITSRVVKRPATWAVIARAIEAGLSTDLAEPATGRLMDSVTSIRRDEAAREALDAARMTTLRTWRRKPGYYVTNPRTLAPAGSDYELWQHGRIMDKACKVVREVMIENLKRKTRTKRDGTIAEIAARALEQELETRLRIALVDPEHAQTAVARVLRGDNILSTKKIRVSVSVLPFAYPEVIETTLGFAALVAKLAA